MKNSLQPRRECGGNASNAKQPAHPYKGANGHPYMGIEEHPYMGIGEHPYMARADALKRILIIKYLLFSIY